MTKTLLVFAYFWSKYANMAIFQEIWKTQTLMVLQNGEAMIVINSYLAWRILIIITNDCQDVDV